MVNCLPSRAMALTRLCRTGLWNTTRSTTRSRHCSASRFNDIPEDDAKLEPGSQPKDPAQNLLSPSSKILERIVDLDCVIGDDTVGSAFRTLRSAKNGFYVA